MDVVTKRKGINNEMFIYLELLQLPLPFASQLVVITVNVKGKYHLVCHVIGVNLKRQSRQFITFYLTRYTSC